MLCACWADRQHEYKTMVKHAASPIYTQTLNIGKKYRTSPTLQSALFSIYFYFIYYIY